VLRDAARLARPERARVAPSRRKRVGTAVLGDLDRSAAAGAGERLVVEARDDVEVRVLELLAATRPAVPDQRVAVGREALVPRRLRREEELVRRRQLLGREVERRAR